MSKEVFFEVVEKLDLTKDEMEFLIEAYRNLYINMYGADIFDYFIALAKTETNIIKNDFSILKVAKNYCKAIDTIRGVEKDPQIKMVLIKDSANNLLGSAILQWLNKTQVKLKDIVVVAEKELKKEIWKNGVSYIIEYLKSLNIQKMYLEVPLRDPTLLIRADDLGFSEDSIDIPDNTEEFAYIMHKNLSD